MISEKRKNLGAATKVAPPCSASPVSSDSTQPDIVVGTRFHKIFEGYGTFEGNVTEISGSLCAVVYSDGDTEVIDVDEVAGWIAHEGANSNTAAAPTTSADSEADANADGEGKTGDKKDKSKQDQLARERGDADRHRAHHQGRRRRYGGSATARSHVSPGLAEYDFVASQDSNSGSDSADVAIGEDVAAAKGVMAPDHPQADSDTENMAPLSSSSSSRDGKGRGAGFAKSRKRPSPSKPNTSGSQSVLSSEPGAGSGQGKKRTKATATPRSSSSERSSERSPVWSGPKRSVTKAAITVTNTSSGDFEDSERTDSSGNDVGEGEGEGGASNLSKPRSKSRSKAKKARSGASSKRTALSSPRKSSDEAGTKREFRSTVTGKDQDKSKKQKRVKMHVFSAADLDWIESQKAMFSEIDNHVLQTERVD